MQANLTEQAARRHGALYRRVNRVDLGLHRVGAAGDWNAPVACTLEEGAGHELRFVAQGRADPCRVALHRATGCAARVVSVGGNMQVDRPRVAVQLNALVSGSQQVATDALEAVDDSCPRVRHKL